MRKNRTIYVATAIILIIIIAIAYAFVAFSRGGVVVAPQAKVAPKVKCEPFTLKVSPEDGQRINQLISTMSNTSAFGLAFKRKQLYTIGDILDQHVPPFQFLGYIFSNPRLAQDMVNIRKNKMKYDRFVEGLRKNMLKESESKCFEVTAKGFLQFLGVNEERGMKLLTMGVKNGRVDKKAFKPFVNLLIDEKSR